MAEFKRHHRFNSTVESSQQGQMWALTLPEENLDYEGLLTIKLT